jgi:hypothetical protein
VAEVDQVDSHEQQSVRVQTLKTIAILSKIGNAGKSLPRSTFDSFAPL